MLEVNEADHPEWEPMLQRILVDLEDTLAKLQKNWEDIGDQQGTRMMFYEQAYNHIKGLLSDMVTESETKKQHLAESIKKLLAQTSTLRKELELDKPKSYEQVQLNKVEEMLKEDLEYLKCLKEERLIAKEKLLIKEQEICKKLGVKSASNNLSILPTQEELDSFKLYVQTQENEKNRLEGVFTDMRTSIIRMMGDLNVSASSSFVHLVCHNSEDFILTNSNITKVKELRDQLKTQIEETKCCIEKMKEDLLALWKYLDEPTDACQSFLDKYSDYSTTTMNALSMEIKRCKEKRKENISRYVTQIRSELMNLWDMCKYCEAEKNSFAPFYSNTFTEDLLTLHELELERLRKFYNDNRIIFDLLEQRESFLNKIKELLQRANNPDRFHNRGGQLLMEEKERKVIQKKLPKIEAELKQLIDKYESTHNQMFTIYGTSLENVLAESWQSLNLEKETIKKARKEAKDKSMKKSPLNSSKKTPGMSHLSIHRGPMLGLSKRKLFTPSPNTSAKRRNKNGDKPKTTVTASKIRRSGKLPKIVVQKGQRSSKGGEKKSCSVNNSITDTTYNQFQGHMTGREELHSSLLPEQILRNSNKVNMRTPVRTPAKPLRKNLSAATTPVHNSTPRPLHSPRFINTPKLTTAPSNLPFIF